MANRYAIVVQADDWTAIYVDGECRGQDHHIRIEDLPHCMDADTHVGNVHYKHSDALMEYAYEHGNLPQTYAEARQHDPSLPDLQ